MVRFVLFRSKGQNISSRKGTASVGEAGPLSVCDQKLEIRDTDTYGPRIHDVFGVVRLGEQSVKQRDSKDVPFRTDAAGVLPTRNLHLSLSIFKVTRPFVQLAFLVANPHQKYISSTVCLCFIPSNIPS